MSFLQVFGSGPEVYLRAVEWIAAAHQGPGAEISGHPMVLEHGTRAIAGAHVGAAIRAVGLAVVLQVLFV